PGSRPTGWATGGGSSMLRDHGFAPVILAIVAVAFTAVGIHAVSADAMAVQIAEPSSNFMSWTYMPSAVTVAFGESVTWNNAGGAPHTVTADDGSFDSGNMDPGAVFAWTPPVSGTYAYHCTFHPWMTGTVVVTGGASS